MSTLMVLCKDRSGMDSIWLQDMFVSGLSPGHLLVFTVCLTATELAAQTPGSQPGTVGKDAIAKGVGSCGWTVGYAITMQSSCLNLHHACSLCCSNLYGMDVEISQLPSQLARMERLERLDLGRLKSKSRLPYFFLGLGPLLVRQWQIGLAAAGHG